MLGQRLFYRALGIPLFLLRALVHNLLEGSEEGLRMIEGASKLLEGEDKKGEGGDFLKELGKFVNWVNQEQQKAEAIKDAVLKVQIFRYTRWSLNLRRQA